MKNIRQVAILDIIEKNDLETQEDLANALKERGMHVTQATVSRDIKELRLLKVLTPAGTYKYATADKASNGLNERFMRMLGESVLSVSSSGNLVVVKTLNGSANVAAEALDSLHWTDIIGTLAGDNTILLVIREGADVSLIVDQIKQMMR
ncbi:MAG: arginine repressor [Clostridia bacterium]|nr:arginine repressor [Clostridia bacterium]